MADYDVQIRISADDRNAQQSIGRLQTGFRQLGTHGSQSLRGIDTANRGLLSSLGNLQSVALGSLGVLGGQLSIQAIGNLRQMGEEARFARLAFEEMAGGPDRAVTALNQLREATGGVIDDVTLMTQSTRLQLLGLADGAQEAGELFATLSQIARITGQTIDSAISTFQLTIANESFMRLDSLGLSVESVKNRVEELKAAGMDASDAFRQAVVEGMAGVVETIGDAATAGITEFERLRTRAENEMRKLGEVVNQVMESIAGAINDAFEAGETGTQAAQQAIIDNAGTAAILAQRFGAGGQGDRGTFERILDEIQRQSEAGDVRPDFVAGALGFVDEQQLEMVQFALENMNAAARERLELEQELNREEQRFLSMLGRQNFELEQQARLAAEAAAAIEVESSMDAATEAAQRLAALHFSSSTGFFRPDDVREAQNLVTVFEQAYDRLTELHEAGRVSDSIFEGFKAAAAQVREWADEIERGAEALRNLSLDEMHGVGVTNPALADATSALARYLRAEGMDDEEIDAIVDMLDLRSGRQTELSQRFENEILPGIRDIYDQFGREAAVAALVAYVEGMRNAAETGQMPADPFLLTGYMRVGGGGPSVTVQPGWGHLAVAQALGMPLEDLYAQGILRPDQMLHPGDVISAGGKLIDLNELTKRGGPAWSWGGPADTADTGDMVTDSERISTALENAASSVERMPEALEPVVDSLGEGVTLADIIRETLETIAATEYEVRLAVTADASDIPQWLYSLIDSRIMQLNRATGSPPGSDPRRGGAGGRATRLG